MGIIEKLLIRIGEATCNMVFMVLDTNSYKLLLGLDFLIKIGVVVDMECGLI
jgi:Ethanolamine utilization protein EutJ (predicted chaperonin)